MDFSAYSIWVVVDILRALGYVAVGVGAVMVGLSCIAVSGPLVRFLLRERP